ncbi:glycosyltransferase family 4 protein [Gordonia sp. N1V]|uniref:glycosyltransferase family 4 protein n=1 Tax=Gordonia sp. N1V TaxID=3034163 RepID=UPI0023E29D2E|nr:glycosyltransferase family 4 protein [Gordonia sp. N1V]MDF3284087.1 glycosyltransferase family 4 protein [Gordonia sp. N1V]
MRRRRARPSDRPTVKVFGLNYAPEPSGSAPYTAGLAEWLAANGYEVEVIAGLPHYPQWKRYPTTESVEADHLRVRRRWHVIPRSPRTMGRMIMEATYAVQVPFVSGADVYVAASPSLLGSLAVVLRALPGRIPVVLWVQDIYSRGSEEALGNSRRITAVISRLERFLYRHVNHIIVPHTGFASSIGEVVGDRTPVDVVANWSHFDASAALEANPLGEELIRELVGAPPEWAVAVHAGNIGVKQGLENVVEAARVAHENGSRIRFVLLGDGNARPDLEKIAEGLPNLHFIDPLPREQVIPFLDAADILIVNERLGVREMSIPSKLTTYWSTSTPVVCCVDSTGLTAQEVNRANGGVVVAPGEPKALVDAIEELVADEERGRELVRHGAQHRIRHLGSEPALTAIADILNRSMRDR